ncbi:MAG: hypothetical protein NXI28_26095, partial [bacterium]|nr:hypothetical protein [bacterium]
MTDTKMADCLHAIDLTQSRILRRQARVTRERIGEFRYSPFLHKILVRLLRLSQTKNWTGA